MAARERIRNNYEQGLTISETLKKTKKVTSGIISGFGKHRVGIDVRKDIYHQKRRRIQKEEADKQKTVEALNSSVEKARQVWAMQTYVTKMTNKQLITILCPLRQKYDAPIPSRKYQLLNYYAKWTHRVTPYMVIFPNNAPPPPSATAPPASATVPPPPRATAPPPPSATTPPPSTTDPSPPNANAPPASVTTLPPPPCATAPPLPSATAPFDKAYNDTGSIFDDTDEEDENNDDEEFWRQNNIIIFSTKIDETTYVPYDDSEKNAAADAMIDFSEYAETM